MYYHAVYMLYYIFTSAMIVRGGCVGGVRALLMAIAIAIVVMRGAGIFHLQEPWGPWPPAGKQGRAPALPWATATAAGPGVG